MKRQFLATICAVLLCACSDETDREACKNDGPGTVEVSVTPNAFGTIYTDGNITISGTADSDIRIDRILIGGLDAKGGRDNFGTWSIELTPAQLSQESGLAMLSVMAIDVCGDEHPFDATPVLVKAPSGTPAPGLSVSAAPLQSTSSDEPECYLPADGSAEAAVSVVASEVATGVSVELSSAIEGDFFGASEKKVILEPSEDMLCAPLGGDPMVTTCSGATDVFFRPTEAGRLRLSASAGPSFALDEADLRAVGVPVFTGTSSAVPPQTPVQVVVETDGRLEECVATTDQPNLVSVDADGTELTTGSVAYDAPSCGQRETFDVQFLEGAPVGLSVKIECSDTYGQSAAISLLAGAVPETSDTGG